MWESVTSKLFGNFFMNFNNAIERNMVYALRFRILKMQHAPNIFLHLLREQFTNQFTILL